MSETCHCEERRDEAIPPGDPPEARRGRRGPIPVRPSLRVLACLLAGLPAIAVPAQEPVNAVPIQLPEFEVVGERVPPRAEPWFYARIEGFEVLSSAGEGETRRLLHSLQRFAHALDLVWPGVRPAGSAPAVLVVCGRDGQYAGFQPAGRPDTEHAATSFHLRSFEQSVLVLDYRARVINLPNLDDPAATAAVTATQDPAGDAGDEAGGALVRTGLAVDPYQQLYREYVQFLFAGLRPPPAPWLAEGLSQLFMNLRITATEISVGRIEDPNLAEDPASGGAPTDREFNAALARRALLPMDELFAVAAGSETARHPLNSIWAKQCYAFVHWGLYGDFGRNQRAFLAFLGRTQSQAPTEDLFRACFRMGYADARQALRTHIEMTRTRIAGVRAEAGQKIAFPPPPEVRSATESEIGRLRAAVFSLAGQPAEARTALINAYRLGGREPPLLVALGLSELEAGEADRARKLLEAAGGAIALRPRAAVELSRLRLADARLRPEGDGGRLSAAQVAQVLSPALAARAQQARLAPLYEVIAETWTLSAAAPGPAELAVVEEGVRLFPRHARLAQFAAALRAGAPPK